MSDEAWYVANGETGEQFGPYSDAVLRQYLDDGTVAAGDSIWRAGMEVWETAEVFIWFARRAGVEPAQPELADGGAPEAIATVETIETAETAETGPEAPPAPTPPVDGSGLQAGEPAAVETAAFAALLGRSLTVSAADLEAFAGANAEPFLAYRARMAENLAKALLAWSWPGFLAPLAWLGYRKLYAELAAGVAVFAAGIALAIAFPAHGAVLRHAGAVARDDAHRALSLARSALELED